MNHPIKILVVEDDFLVAKLLCRNLELLRYNICGPVATAQDAIASAKNEYPDVVLMDIRLAGPMDGIEAAQEIGSRYCIPIIFTTGYTDERTLERAKKLNPLAILIKPVTPDHIQPLIDSIFPYVHED